LALNAITAPSQSIVQRSLAEYTADGLLTRVKPFEFDTSPHLDPSRATAQIRSAAVAVLQRVQQYWKTIDYCSGLLSHRRGYLDGERSICAAHMAGRYGLRQGPRISDPLEGPMAVWSEAVAICLNTACHLAQWELAQANPASRDLLRLGRVAALYACKNESISGANWVKTARRISTVGARLHVPSVLAAIPQAWIVINPEAGTPMLLSADQYARSVAAMSVRARESNQPLIVCPPAAPGQLQQTGPC